MKKCPKCKEDNNTKGPYCKKCDNEYHKAYYKKKPESIDKSHIRRKQERRDFLNKEKEKPCIDCGKDFPHYCMDFDHVRGIKEFDLAEAINHKYSMKRIKEEIAKCEIVCANCHRTRTFKRNNGRLV